MISSEFDNILPSRHQEQSQRRNRNKPTTAQQVLNLLLLNATPEYLSYFQDRVYRKLLMLVLFLIVNLEELRPGQQCTHRLIKGNWEVGLSYGGAALRKFVHNSYSKHKIMILI